MPSSLALWVVSNGLHGLIHVHSDVSLKRALVLAWDLEGGGQRSRRILVMSFTICSSSLPAVSDLSLSYFYFFSLAFTSSLRRVGSCCVFSLATGVLMPA
jgi:hypothetical protein